MFFYVSWNPVAFLCKSALVPRLLRLPLFRHGFSTVSSVSFLQDRSKRRVARGAWPIASDSSQGVGACSVSVTIFHRYSNVKKNNLSLLLASYTVHNNVEIRNNSRFQFHGTRYSSLWMERCAYFVPFFLLLPFIPFSINPLLEKRTEIQQTSNKNSPNYVKFCHEKLILIKIVTSFRHENR